MGAVFRRGACFAGSGEGRCDHEIGAARAPFIVDAADRLSPKNFVRHVTELIADHRRAEAIKYFMTQGMGAPSFVVSIMRIIPGVWANLTAVAHTLPYDAALLDGYIAGKPLPADAWSTVRMPTLVLEGTGSPASLRRAAGALAQALPRARLVGKKGLGHTKKLDAKRIAPELTAFFAAQE